MSHFSGIVFGPAEEIADKLSHYDINLEVLSCEDDESIMYNPEGKWDWYVIGGRWNGEILHAGSYDTNQAQKEYLSKVDTPYCFIDLDGNWHEVDNLTEFEHEFRNYLNSISNDVWLTVIDFHI